MNRESVRAGGIRLRAPRLSDAEQVLAACADPVTQHFLPELPSPYTRADAEWWIEHGAEAAWAGGGCVYAIADPSTDHLLGAIGLNRVVPERGQGELGYWVVPGARGRGVASTAVRVLTDVAVAQGFARLELLTSMENIASQRVALAAGFKREGVRRGAAPGRNGARADLVAFARLAGDPPGPTERWLPDLPGGELGDGVVSLRPLLPGDERFLFDLFNEPDVVATSVPAIAPDREEIRLRCARAQMHWLAGERADTVIVDAATGLPAGDLSLYYQEPLTGQAMIGYAMSPAWRGRGYATRAVQLLARWAFAETAIVRLIAGTAPDNRGSQRVLEKAGFRQEGYLRARLPAGGGRRLDDVLFALLGADTLSQSRQPR